MEFSSLVQSFLPLLIVITLGKLVISFFPSTDNKARSVVVFAFIVLAIRYLIWRSLHTFNLTNGLTTTASILVFLVELFGWLVVMTELILSTRRKYHHAEADRSETLVKQGLYNPSVDIFIPTYNEPIDILRKTVIGCQAIEYKNKQVYLLDDGNRPEVKKLAKYLDCNYLTRADRHHAKAGNLNHALPLTNGELIAVFDADFIPSRNFLARTVGFFQRPKLALLQTHQHFYNQDPIAKNWGLGHIFGHPTEDLSGLQIQPMRSYHGSASCFGTSFVVRRSMLEDIGGFYPESIAEDLFTAVTLLAHKYETLYLTESLSAGLAPENIPALFSQRMRWAKGTVQGLFISANPFKLKGLNLMQRIIYGNVIIVNFTSLTLIFSVFILPLFFILGIPPISLNPLEWFTYFVPIFVFQFLTFLWLGDKTTTKIVLDIYSMILSLPVALSVVQTLISPFRGGFSVTPKGITSNKTKTIFYWRLALPMIYLWLVSVFSIIFCGNLIFNSHNQLKFALSPENYNATLIIALFWSVYHLFNLSLALLALREKPQTDNYTWLNIKTPIKLYLNNHQLAGISSQLSEAGVEFIIEDPYLSAPLIKNNSSVKIELTEIGLRLNSLIREVDFNRQQIRVKVSYETLSLAEYRQLISFIFCTPNRWQMAKVPRELSTFLLLLQTIAKNVLTLPVSYFRQKFKHKLSSSVNDWQLHHKLVITNKKKLIKSS